jgi:hypothetical protein
LITAKVQAQLDKERRELELEYQKKVNWLCYETSDLFFFLLYRCIVAM